MQSSERSSIYYDYKLYPAYTPRASDSEESAPVVIVGAGPSGLVTALKLAQMGVSSVVLNAEQGVSEGSRAIVYTRRSMEILHDIGVAQRISEHALPWRFGTSYFRGQAVYRLEAPHDENQKFFPLNNLQQQFLEQYLIDACIADPRISLRWANRCGTITQDGHKVHLEVSSPGGNYHLSTDWLVAADGGRSSIRSALGLRLEGEAFEAFFVIADIRVDLRLPTERLAFFDPAWNPGNTVLVHRQPHGIWRIDYQLPSGEAPIDALAPAALHERIRATLAMLNASHLSWELDWSSVYAARTMTLPRYREDRVLFAGDAAHLLPIFGVRGANTAFQDAQSLAWHLAMVVRGWASDRLLDNYSDERVAAAREIIKESAKSTRFMAPPTDGYHLLRNAVLSLSLRHDFVGPLFHWRTSKAQSYRDSILHVPGDDDALFEAGPARGEAFLDVLTPNGRHLADVIRGGFCLLWRGSMSLRTEIFEGLSQWRDHGPLIRLLILVSQASDVEGFQGLLASNDACIVDRDGRISSIYGLRSDGGAYLFRPDQHVAARWMSLNGSRLHAALAHLSAL